jgi:hypothetical protein
MVEASITNSPSYIYNYLNNLNIQSLKQNKEHGWQDNDLIFSKIDFILTRKQNKYVKGID